MRVVGTRVVAMLIGILSIAGSGMTVDLEAAEARVHDGAAVKSERKTRKKGERNSGGKARPTEDVVDEPAHGKHGPEVSYDVDSDPPSVIPGEGAAGE